MCYVYNMSSRRAIGPGGALADRFRASVVWPDPVPAPAGAARSSAPTARLRGGLLQWVLRPRRTRRMCRPRSVRGLRALRRAWDAVHFGLAELLVAQFVGDAAVGGVAGGL